MATTTTTKALHRSIAILKLPTKMPALASYGQNIVTAMTNNAHFPSPTPTLATVSAAVTAFQTAEAAALARTAGAVATRNAARATLAQLLEQLKSYVQSVADANVENGAAIVLSSGIGVRKLPTHAARAFEAKAGDVSGSAKLVAVAAARRSAYEWQYSVDGGKTWVSAPSTLQAKTTITGLTPGVTVMFKNRPVTKNGEGDWSQTIGLIIK